MNSEKESESHQWLTEVEYSILLGWVKVGKLFELMEWTEANISRKIPKDLNYKGSLLYNAFQCANHSMIIFLFKTFPRWEWETNSLLRWAADLPKELKVEVMNAFLDDGIPLGGVTAEDIFLTFDEGTIRRALEMGLCVRGDEGFSAALMYTGVARPLLKYFKIFRADYPDLEVEAIIATKYFLKDKKKRGCALLGWVGVDMLRKVNDDDPYSEHVELYDHSVLDSIYLDEDTEEFLKLLKIKMTPVVWFKFFQEAIWLHPECMKQVLTWVNDPKKVIQSHPKLAEEALDYALRFFATKEDYLFLRRKEFEKQTITVAKSLIAMGVKCLPEDASNLRSFRSVMYATEHDNEVGNLCWLIYECGDDQQKERLRNLVKTPQLLRIVKRHERGLVVRLALASKREIEAHKLKTVEEVPLEERVKQLESEWESLQHG